MKFRIIDRCCSEYVEIEIKQVDIEFLGETKQAIEIAPAKKGHRIVIHADMTIEYVSGNH